MTNLMTATGLIQTSHKPKNPQLIRPNRVKVQQIGAIEAIEAIENPMMMLLISEADQEMSRNFIM